MPTTYLLPCTCGDSIGVSPSQAGGTVSCSCGAALEVPRLGQLRGLPTKDQQEASSSWGFRQGAVTTCLIAAILFGGAAAWLTATEPAAKQPLDMAAYLSEVDRNVENIRPVESYEIWLKGYQPLASLGFVDPNEKYSEALKQMIATQRLYRNGLLVAAAIALATSVVAGLTLSR